MISLLKQIINPTLINISTPTKILQTATKPQPIKSIRPSKKPIPSAPKKEAEIARRTAKLIMVTANNNNKFYEMTDNGDGTFTAFYGRVGTQGARVNYALRQWDKKRQEKIRKGYADQTHLFAKMQSTECFAEMENKEIERLINDLNRFAKSSISNNYTVSAEQVTRKQIDEAQGVLDDLVSRVKLRMRVPNFNKKLIELYQVIPRKMAKVKDHLIINPKGQADLEEIEKMLAEEQATLDVMRGQVETLDKHPKKQSEKITLTDALGITVEDVSDAQLIKQIKKMMGDHKDKFYKAYKVTNLKTQDAFDTFLKQSDDKKTELFWHGSRNENWLSILRGGLVLRPANAIITGKMFGYGLYFADKFRKSLNYSSLNGSYWTGGNQKQGYLALYDVHVGNQFKIQKYQPWCYELSASELKKRGNFDSLYAKGGADLRNNEYIVYNQNQCTVRYIVEVR
ncbi:WGR domain-containing protein [Saprospiraceae bacterium]|jgi:poly [ADP-ribose] polymerase|nr:WGR domain-containing protein [Saprospiraceae bacterium]MDF1864721.1 WGR domain-containing protein [Saprospiraceae bacterium]